MTPGIRRADAIALAAAALWLGGNGAVALTAGIMFFNAKGDFVEASPADVGELLAQVFPAWAWLGAALGAVFLVARIVGWTLRLRHGALRRWSLVGVLLAVVVATTTALGIHAVLRAGVLRDDWTRALERAEADPAAAPEASAAETAFQAEHRRATALAKALSAALAASIIVLGVSLGRRDVGHTASRPPSAG